MKKNTTPLLDMIEKEIRASNQKMNGLNMNPSVKDYDERANKIRVELENRLQAILYK